VQHQCNVVGEVLKDKKGLVTNIFGVSPRACV